ncbi:hypothetical protein AURDEDRAFT_175556 [Auricularia subglabra TFB-10046 SS5]|uniref:Uncharacterized protein n=1 Tax=Auricularia subglabra (strain TFB-10046 / SS5) TaxID=717982 RepID=J0CX91_AURST|nr:hypothetical protein AURDEDRAFT_175556 [Auricularia subglabra TFB-10046 SS5]
MRLAEVDYRWIDYGPVQNWFIACILRAIYTDRSMTSYGTSYASELQRREQEETPHLFEEHTWFIAAVYYAGSVLFLGAPYVYFIRIQSVDRTRFGDGVSTERWHSFVSALVKEWRDSNLVATVLLAANVSVLALPNLDSTCHLLSVLSMMAAIGSVIMGFYLVWRHEPHESSSSQIGLHYFMRARIRTSSSVPLSFALSIPLVLLLWAFLGFLAAISTNAFHGQGNAGGFLSTLIPNSTSFGVVVMLVALITTGVFMWMFFANAWVPCGVEYEEYHASAGMNASPSLRSTPASPSNLLAGTNESWYTPHARI